MAPRPYWSGTIRISLVSLSVEMFTALDAGKKIAFHQIYKPTGERVHQQLVAGDRVIDRSKIVKGFEVDKDEYVLFEPDEITDLKIKSSKAMEFSRFVAYDAIDAIYFDTPYYLAPSGKGDLTTFGIIRDAMRTMKVMGLGQIVISGSERLCAVKPCGQGLLLETLHYHEEIKKSGHYFDTIKTTPVAGDEADLAQELIKRKIGKFDPDAFHDHYTDALEELVNSRIEKREPHVEAEAPTAKVINLMDALRQSLKSSAGEPQPKDEAPAHTAKKPAKRTSSQKKAG